MSGGLSWARADVEARHRAAQSVWRDGAASHYRLNIHARVTDVLDRYFRALHGLEEAVERAEHAASGIS